jgi:hypothetical protein
MENYTHMLIETADEMQRSIENVDKVVAEQAELIKVVEKSDKAKQFETFTTSLKQQITETLGQKKQLVFRHAQLESVIEMCKDENIAAAISTFCIAFGIFGIQPEHVTRNKQADEPVSVETVKVVEFPKKD